MMFVFPCVSPGKHKKKDRKREVTYLDFSVSILADTVQVFLYALQNTLTNSFTRMCQCVPAWESSFFRGECVIYDAQVCVVCSVQLGHTSICLLLL